jgi:hypothetical protein
MSVSLGDFDLGQTARIFINTFAGNVPATPTVNPTVAVYSDNTNETTNGVTQPSVDYDGKAGMHLLVIDFSADPTFYVAGKDYHIVFTAGTVDGVDLTRTVYGRFSIRNRNAQANVVRIAGQTVTASAAVSFPAVVANETTVASRASQVSVDAIPTNPLLTTDPRLANLNAPISAIPTTTLLSTDPRLNNLNAPINAIPTNPALATDPRFAFLDASIATTTNGILAAITGLNNLSAKCNLFGASVLEAPETGSTVYEFTLVVNDDEGKLGNLDAVPTVTAVNASGVSRSGNLSAVTNPSVGRYRFTYTVASTHPRESLRIETTGSIAAELRYAIWGGAVVDYDQASTLAQIVADLSLKPTLAQIDAGTMAGNVTALTQRLTAARAGYLDGVLLAQNYNHRIVHVTNSHLVAAEIRETQTNSISAAALQAAVYTTISTNMLSSVHTGYTTPGTVGKTLNDTNTSLSTLLTRVPAATAQLVTDLTTMLVNSGTALVKWTANALSLAPAGGGGGGGNVTVSPEAFINLDDTLLEENVFTFFNNEVRTYLVTLAEGVFDGNPMTFCIEKSDKTTLVAVTGLTSITNAVSVTVPSTVYQNGDCLFWSLRDTTTGRIILYGPAVQKYAAFNN